MKKYIQIIQIILFIAFSFSQDWSMTINAQDVNQAGASDYITLEMCQGCNDEFKYGEDEYDLPSPPNYYTDIAFVNFNWVGTSDENGVTCDNPEFYIDKRSFHPAYQLAIWPIGGFTNLPNNNSNIELFWEFDEINTDYELYIYIDDIGYNMRTQNSATINSSDLLINYDPELGTFNANVKIPTNLKPVRFSQKKNRNLRSPRPIKEIILPQSAILATFFEVRERRLMPMLVNHR